MTLDVDIIYFDVEKIKTNISVFHKDENTVVIRMRGTVAKEGKVIKQQVVEDGSNEIVASTGIVAVDGKFNSTVSRNAIKKTCVLVVSKLF
jgi:dihydroxyacid dehydratase/phosphogluconate dehydratase